MRDLNIVINAVEDHCLTDDSGVVISSVDLCPIVAVANHIIRISLKWEIGLYTNRAANFGLNVKIVGKTYNRTFDLPTSGYSLSFGGGKDSRMVLGLLREAGTTPAVYTSGAANATDLPEAQITESLTGKLADRIMPTLMSLPRVLVHGSGLGEVAHETPWQRYYDCGSRNGLEEMALMLKSFGVNMDLVPPASVLPYNLIQRILHDRYPDLYRYQRSVRKEQPNEKNLQVSLLKIYCGIDFSDQCSDTLFRSLLKKFVKAQTTRPHDFGLHRYRRVINLEMRAIIFNKQDDRLFSGLRAIPVDWEGKWIDYIHTYVHPDINPEFLEIYREYAPVLQDTDEASFRVPV